MLWTFTYADTCTFDVISPLYLYWENRGLVREIDLEKERIKTTSLTKRKCWKSVSIFINKIKEEKNEFIFLVYDPTNVQVGPSKIMSACPKWHTFSHGWIIIYKAYSLSFKTDFQIILSEVNMSCLRLIISMKHMQSLRHIIYGTYAKSQVDYLWNLCRLEAL